MLMLIMAHPMLTLPVYSMAFRTHAILIMQVEWRLYHSLVYNATGTLWRCA